MGKEHLLSDEQLKQIEMDEGVNEKKGTKIKIAIELRWVPCLDVSAQGLDILRQPPRCHRGRT